MTESPDATPVGSPDWWRIHADDIHGGHGRSGRGRPRRPLDGILTEALGLLADDGLYGLTMRALARRMESSTSTLYRQLPGGKEELWARLAEYLLGDLLANVGDAVEDADDWSDILERSALAAFDMFRRHPNTAALFAARVHFGPMSMARYEASLRLLRRGGFSPTTSAAADRALARLIVGYALQSPLEETPNRETVAEYYRSVDGTQFPTVADVAATQPEDLRAEFAFAVRTFMDGLRKRTTQ